MTSNRTKEWKPLADQGHAYAQYNLGIMYANGYGVPEDDAEAVRWYRLAADQGHAVRAQYNLGLKYANGEGVLQDNVTAHMWFNIAGANGDEAGRDNREKIEWKMTPADISEAQKRARIYMADQCAIALTTVTLERDALLARVESSDADSQSASARLAGAQQALAVALAEADALRAGLGDEAVAQIAGIGPGRQMAAEQQSDGQMTAANSAMCCWRLLPRHAPFPGKRHYQPKVCAKSRF